MGNWPKYGTIEWRIFQYERKLEENRGHNYQYWTESMWAELEAKGYEMYPFQKRGNFQEYTYSELEAKEIVEKLKGERNYARIICGYSQNVQRKKTFTVIYRPKGLKINKGDTT